MPGITSIYPAEDHQLAGQQQYGIHLRETLLSLPGTVLE